MDGENLKLKLCSWEWYGRTLIKDSEVNSDCEDRTQHDYGKKGRYRQITLSKLL